MVIIPDAFTTGFEEHMSTFSQEVRALNPVISSDFRMFVV